MWRHDVAFFVCLFAVLIVTAHTLPQRLADEGDYGRTCLALEMFTEARSEGRAGMLEVGRVVLRRTIDPLHRWPQSICDVVQQPSQFAGVDDWHYPRRPQVIDAKSWQLSQQLADELINAGPEGGECNGALFFNQRDTYDSVCHVGVHYFYAIAPAKGI